MEPWVVQRRLNAGVVAMLCRSTVDRAELPDSGVCRDGGKRRRTHTTPQASGGACGSIARNGHCAGASSRDGRAKPPPVFLPPSPQGFQPKAISQSPLSLSARLSATLSSTHHQRRSNESDTHSQPGGTPAAGGGTPPPTTTTTPTTTEYRNNSIPSQTPPMSVEASEVSALSIATTPERQFPTAPTLAVKLRYEPPKRDPSRAPEDPCNNHYHRHPRTATFVYEAFPTTVKRTLRLIPALLVFMWDLHVAGAMDDIRCALHLRPYTRMWLFIYDSTAAPWVDDDDGDVWEITPQKLFNEIERVTLCNDEDGLFGNGSVVVVRVNDLL
ncbi:hypothetical protein DFH27DRAFT_616731 [Peziza echinospora]|nr:hypothetical protein DFH27DRAFT_616731 [Peziza echinospora]